MLLPVNCLMKFDPKVKQPFEPVPGTITMGGMEPYVNVDGIWITRRSCASVRENGASDGLFFGKTGEAGVLVLMLSSELQPSEYVSCFKIFR